jgi:BioD-like phosphotransacetylase family protein
MISRLFASRRAALAALLLIASAAAHAQSYRCVGNDGKKYYGSSVPPQCIGVVVEQINAQGSVVKRIEPQARSSADSRAKQAADEAERKKQAAIAKELARRDQALLATYSSTKDVEDMRTRALENDQRIQQDMEAKLADLKKRKTSGQAVDSELAMQESMLAEKKKEISAINAKYDDDKKRFLELTSKK